MTPQMERKVKPIDKMSQKPYQNLMNYMLLTNKTTSGLDASDLHKQLVTAPQVTPAQQQPNYIRQDLYQPIFQLHPSDQQAIVEAAIPPPLPSISVVQQQQQQRFRQNDGQRQGGYQQQGGHQYQ